ncbi:GTP cyclohydrolase FolE2 [Desulfonatronovibrio hydrogenovorans]|uniref:GTP cyclohydrolase FolE2 n=1 Tax=Desulfonatronovibrio hydrogenovorans TaxID=53245 RepID=UPI00048B9369|nr:GTP cyclohydrolase FolE2 [Desulfonatronovibrio hydrogenovorans]
MQDIQNGPSEVPMPIDRVGVKNLKIPLLVQDRSMGSQHTTAAVDLCVDLPAKFKGTHMSRFLEALSHWSQVLNYESFRELLTNVRSRLEAQRARLRFDFPYFYRRKAPESGHEFVMDFSSFLSGELVGQEIKMTLGVEVPVMTVCPCSLAISEKGAHSQRALVRIKCGFKGLLWLEELIDTASESGSSPVYPLLKREDEKFVTDQAFSRPSFVEDVVRRAAQSLDQHRMINWYEVEVESFESIHNHSAYAIISRH